MRRYAKNHLPYVLPLLVAISVSFSMLPTPDVLHIIEVNTSSDLHQFFHYTRDHIPFVSAHRGGATKGFPENCLQTFENTLSHTYAILEVDPRYTKDSVIVLMHDPTLDRTTTGQGKIADHTLAALKDIKLKDPGGHETRFHIPTLDEALMWAKGKTILVLDQKDVSVEARVGKIEAHQAEAYAILIVYSLEEAQRCHALNPKIMMEIMVPDQEKMLAFDSTGIPWENVVAFVGHQQPDNPSLYALIHQRGAMCMAGSSRNYDQAYQQQQINRQALSKGYQSMIQTGIDIIEADLGIEAGVAIATMQSKKRASPYFKTIHH